MTNEEKEDLHGRLAQMQQIIGAYYEATTGISSDHPTAPNTKAPGIHTFIEFTGLMNEYLKICEEALRRGQDFTQASRHAAYIGEKLGCIFPQLAEDPELMAAFQQGLAKG